MATKRRVLVQQDPEHPVEPEVLALAVVETSKAAKRLLSCGLSEHALGLLVNDLIPASKRPGVKQVLTVLLAAARLDEFVVKSSTVEKECVCEAVIASSPDRIWQRGARNALEAGVHLGECPRALSNALNKNRGT